MFARGQRMINITCSFAKPTIVDDVQRNIMFSYVNLSTPGSIQNIQNTMDVYSTREAVCSEFQLQFTDENHVPFNLEPGEYVQLSLVINADQTELADMIR